MKNQTTAVIVRERAARVLRHIAGQLTATYRPGDPSPCCENEGERLFASPWEPGYLVCSGDGAMYPAASQ